MAPEVHRTLHMSVRAHPSRSRPFTAAIHELSARSEPACLLDLEGNLLFVNDAWERFARENGGHFADDLVGTSVFEHLRGETPRRMLRGLLRRAAHPLAGARPPSFTSECNGPEVARLVTTQVARVVAGADVLGFALTQRVVRERPVAEVYEVVGGTTQDFRMHDGTFVQCSCCRRTRRPDDPEAWDFVPALVAAPPPETRFDYCPLCLELHAPPGALEDEGRTP